MNDADEIWVGAVKADGNITKNPLLFVKNFNNKFQLGTHPEWAFLNSLQMYPGLFFPQQLECVYFCSFRREDVCSFIAGAQAAYCITFRKMRNFFGINSGENCRNSSICYNTLMRPEESAQKESDEESECES